MRTRFKRRKYFVHPSSQFKYIAFSILPALIMSLACTYFLLKAGGLILKTQKEDHFVEISSVTQAIYALETEGCPKDTVEELRRLINENCLALSRPIRFNRSLFINPLLLFPAQEAI